MQNYAKSSLPDLLFTLKRNIVESIKKDGCTHDLTFSQVEVLNFIGPHSKKTMKDLAEYLKITPPSATEIVAEMERKGLVKRIGDKKDRRVIFITIAPSAKKLYVASLKRKDQVFKKMLAKLDERDRKNLERIIRILITN